MDVLLALCKHFLIQDEINHAVKYHPNLDQNYVMGVIIKELQDLDDNEDMIESVKKIKKEEKQRRAKVAAAEGGVFTAHHEEAARKLIQHLRNFVRRQQLKKGKTVTRYTKE